LGGFSDSFTAGLHQASRRTISLNIWQCSRRILDVLLTLAKTSTSRFVIWLLCWSRYLSRCLSNLSSAAASFIAHVELIITRSAVYLFNAHCPRQVFPEGWRNRRCAGHHRRIL
jgi:hypothetical protein